MRAPIDDSVPTNPGESLRPVCALLEALTRYAHGTRIYGPEHPQVVGAGRKALDAFHSARSCRWPIELGVGRDAFTVGGELLSAGSDVACLANAMYESSIAGIRLFRAPSTSELAELAAWVASLPHPRTTSAPGCGHESDRVLEIIPVSGRLLMFSRTSESAGSAAPIGWSDICQSLLAKAPGPYAADAVRRLHAQIDQADASQQHMATCILDAVLATDAHDTPPTHETAPPSALGELSPELRRSILGVCAMRGSAWLDLHADEMPAEELADALRSIDRPGHAPPATTILLLHRLVRSTALSPEARAELVGLSRAWDQADSEAAGLLCASIQIDDQTSQSYRDAVHRAATMNSDHVHEPTGAFQFEPVALRVCELALEILATKTADELTADHLHLLLERIAMLAEAGRVDLMVAASEAASRLTTSSIEAVARHAEKLAAAAHERSHVGNVVRRLGTCDESIASLAQLLVIAPEPVISTLASQLADLEIGMDHAHIRAVAEAVCPEALRSVIARAIQSPEPWVNGLIDFLSACTDEVIHSAGEPLFRSRNHDLRARTLRVLDGRLVTWPGRLIELALSHPDPAIVAIGRVRLQREPGHCRPEILAALLTGALTGDVPDESTASAAIDALISQGAQGVERAAIVLRRMSHGCSRRRASICRHLAESLEPFRSRPDVAGALRAWRMSPFGVVFELLGAHTHRKAA